MSWWVQGVVILGLIILGVLIVIFAPPIPWKGAGMGGRHHWIEPADLEPDDALPVREVQHAPGTCTAEEAGDYEVCEDREPGEGVTGEDRTD